MTDPVALSGIVVAALGGAAIGVERQRSGHASGTRARFAGIRTFTLLGGIAGLAGWLASLDLIGLALVLVLSGVGAVRFVQDRARPTLRALKPWFGGAMIVFFALNALSHLAAR